MDKLEDGGGVQHHILYKHGPICQSLEKKGVIVTRSVAFYEGMSIGVNRLLLAGIPNEARCNLPASC